jgi:hypothetical protein
MINFCWAQRIKPIILATQEVEIRKIEAQGSQFKRPNFNQKRWMWWCTTIIPAIGSIHRIAEQADHDINARPYLKSSQSKRVWVMAKVVEHLPSKCEVLNSNPSTVPKREKCRDFIIIIIIIIISIKNDI